MTTLLGEPFDFYLFGKVIEGFSVDRDKLGDRLKTALERQAGKGEVKLAYVYAYHAAGSLQRLPRPTIFLVSGPGDAVPAPHDASFPNPEFRRWRLHPRDEAARFDVELGPIEELVDLDLIVAGEPPEPDGATVIRGADGRLYCIPANLETFEVKDEDARSTLELSDGADLGALRVKTLTARSALAARSALTTRSALTLRSAVTARSALAARSALSARSALTLRSALTAARHDDRDD